MGDDGSGPSSDADSSGDKLAPWLEQLIFRQEATWSGPSLNRASLESLLAEATVPDAMREEALLELIFNEVVLREQAGESPSLSEYQVRFPSLAETLRIQWEIDRFLADDNPTCGDWSVDPTGDTGNLQVDDTLEDGDATDRPRVGRYLVEEELGRGGIGIVHRAWDPRLKRVVALKRLRAGLDATPDDLQRMRVEAESIARLHHPHIVQIHDVGEHQGLPYLAMEYCDGGSLADYLRDSPMTPRDAAKLMLQVANGVAAAHENEIIHRDLKPGNVLLVTSGDSRRRTDNANDVGGSGSNAEFSTTRPVSPRTSLFIKLKSLSSSKSKHAARASNGSGQESPIGPLPIPKISDFGLAKLLTGDASATATGNILGTPAYMAPEQAFGDAKRAGPAADVYSLGAILYECLTGRPPFRGTNVAEILQQVREQEPICVRRLEPTIPLDLETITHKCLRKLAHARYATATELAEDLTRFLNDRPILARRQNWLESTTRVVRRYPWVSALGMTSVLLLIAVAVGSLMFAGQLNRSKVVAEQSAREARLGQADALVGRAHGIRLSRRSGQRFEALADIKQAVEIGRNLEQPPEWFDTIRDEAIAALLLPDVDWDRKWRESEPIFSADLSDDGSRYAVASNEGDVLVRDAETQAELARIPRLDAMPSLRFIGPMRLMVRGGEPNYGLELWSLDTSVPKRMWKVDKGCEYVDVSHDGDRIAVGARDALLVLDATTGKILSRMDSAPFSREPRLRLHPTHPYVVLYAYMSPRIQVRNWETGAVVFDAQPGKDLPDSSGFTGCDWSPDGTEFIVIHGHEEAMYWFEFDPRRGIAQLERTMPLVSGEGSGGGPQIRYLPGSDRLLRLGWGSRLQLLEATTGRLLAQSVTLSPCFTKDRFDIDNFRTNSAGQLVSLFRVPDQADAIETLKVAAGYELRTLRKLNGKWVGRSAFSPMGDFLVAFNDGVTIFDAGNAKALQSTDWLGFLCAYSVQFDSTGHLLTSGFAGCFRWPWRIEGTDVKRLELGIPQRIQLPPGQVMTATSDDGTVLISGIWNGFGTPAYAGYWLKYAGEPAPRKIFADEGGSTCAVSPDGRIAIIAREGLSILDTMDPARPPIALVVGATPRFSRDGDWWLAGGTRRPTGVWQSTPASRFGAPCDLNDDGSIVVTLNAAGTLGLVDAASGRVLARLEAPVACGDARFGLSGSRLLCFSQSTTTETQQIDLRRIREGLATLGLDWDTPPFPPMPAQTSRLEAVLAPGLQQVHHVDQLWDLIDREALARATREPDKSDVVFAAAMAAIRFRDFDKALELLDQTCNMLPEAITPRQWRAYVRTARGDFFEAIEDASWVLDRFPDEDLRLRRAECHLQVKNYAEAIDDCTQVITNRPLLGRFAYGLRGICEARRGDDERAQADQAKFLEVTRNDVPSLDIAARPMVGDDISVHCSTIALLLAEKMQSLGGEMDPDQIATIGLAYLRNDRFDESTTWFDRCLTAARENESEKHPPAEGIALWGLATAADRQDKPDVAADYQRQALAWKPTETPDAMSLALLRVLKSEFSRLVPP